MFFRGVGELNENYKGIKCSLKVIRVTYCCCYYKENGPFFLDKIVLLLYIENSTIFKHEK